jgi:hypothetical protein
MSREHLVNESALRVGPSGVFSDLTKTVYAFSNLQKLIINRNGAI